MREQGVGEEKWRECSRKGEQQCKCPEARMCWRVEIQQEGWGGLGKGEKGRLGQSSDEGGA